MMIDIEKCFNSMSQQLMGSEKKLDLHSALNVYFGFSPEGFMRISFLSSEPAPKMESTKVLRVSQGKESSKYNWTCFDLLQPDAKQVFFTFGNNLVESVENENDERKALVNLKKRYITWKNMFKNETNFSVSKDVLQGIFGELFYLKNYLMEQYGAAEAVNSWGGSDNLSKDFSLLSSWYEVKTITTNTNVVHISSLSQLSSDIPGKLIVIRVERMSDEYRGIDSSIGDLFSEIIKLIDDEIVEGVFLSKLSALGIDISDSSINSRFCVKSVNKYRVDDSFPRLTEEDIGRKEICDVQYSLIVNSLTDFMEE